jgi:Tol biopolymer transport system component
MKMMKHIYLCLVAVLALTAVSCSKKPTDVIPPSSEFPLNVRDDEPAWSPCGTILSYYEHGLAGSGIYFINPDGTDKRPFLLNVEFEKLWGSHDWSPDGKWLVLTELNSRQIYKIRVAEGDSLTQLTSYGGNSFPSWSPDGKRIAWDTNYNDSLGANVIWLMNDDGSNKKDISQHQVGEWRMPDWLPNGRIIHIRYPGDVFSSEIFIMDSSGLYPVRVTHNNVRDSHPKASPDGLKIVYTSQAENQAPRVWVINADGTNPRKLTETGAMNPCWSPDGTKIVYASTVNGRLWIMNADGSNKQQLTF